MSKKIAIIVAGHIRNYSETIKTWQCLFELNCDFYIHTYNTVGYWSPNESVHTDNTTVLYNDILNIYPNVKDIVIETIDQHDQQIKELSKMFMDRKVSFTRPYNWISMHLKRFRALDRFYSINASIYDTVMLIRPDCTLVPNIRVYLVNYDLNEKMLLNFFEQDWYWHDWIHVSSYDTMKILKDNYIKSIYDYKNDFTGKYDPHTLYYYMMTTIFSKDKCVDMGLKLNLINTPGGCHKLSHII
jgi:hypothetical protein